MAAALADAGRPATRRQFCYALLRFPLSLAEAALVTALWSLALALLGLPLLGWLMLRLSWQVNRAVPLSPAVLAAGCLLGLLLLLAAPQVTHWLAAADTAIARSLLGAGRGADLSARIGELERSRARVVDSAETERRRIERDLHDGAQQRLVSLAMNLGRAKARFADDPDGARASSTRPTPRPSRPWSSCATWSAGCIRRCCPTAAWTPRSPAWPR